MADVDNVATAIEAGRKIGRMELAGTIATHPGGRPYIVQSNGDLKDVEWLLGAPVAARGSVAVLDAASFLAYVNRFKDAGTVVFADVERRTFEAILDYHMPGDVIGPRWGRHRAVLCCAPTLDWRTWALADNKSMSQEEFARFIENNLPNIVEPDGASLLQIALTLEAKKSVDFRSSTRLDNGQTQFRYEETIEGRAGGTQEGSIVVPTSFILGLEPFPGTGLRRVDARFRYRIKDARLSMWFELIRSEEVLRKAFDEVASMIRAGVAGIVVLAGSAPAVRP